MLPAKRDAQSPLRILERSYNGEFKAGSLGVVMSTAGLGKTAFLVQIGLEQAFAGKRTFHLSLSQPSSQVRAWYRALYEDHPHPALSWDELTAHLSILAYSDAAEFDAQALQKALAPYLQQTSEEWGALLVDDWEWRGAPDQRSLELRDLKDVARWVGCPLWMSAQTYRSQSSPLPAGIVAPCDRFEELIDLPVILEPQGPHVSVRLLNAEPSSPTETRLSLDCDSMRLVCENQEASQLSLPPSAYTLLSGAAHGAEAEFGAQAEAWGCQERHFSFPGRAVARHRGVVELSHLELRQGAVHPAYLEAQLHRSFPKTPDFQKMLQTIWHQVISAGEVFVVGLLQKDGTVRGGTGWAAELGRHFQKPTHVFDQERQQWFRWQDSQWKEVHPPRIQRTRFTGTGTRFLSDAGKAAIARLYANSFKP